MKVELWFDFLCPFSYVAKTYLQKALEQIDHQGDIKVFYHSFSVAPYVENTLSVDSHEFLSFHKDITYQQAKDIHTKLGEKYPDIVFNFDDVVITSTNKAHQVMHMIPSHKIRSQYIDLVFKALFIDKEDVSKLETLVKIGASVNLKEEDVKAVFLTDMYEEGMLEDYEELMHLELKGVPTIVIDRMYFLSGAQSYETYLEMFEKLYTPKKHSLTEVCMDCPNEY